MTSIKINVSGVIFETTRETILKINYLKYLLDDTNLDLNTTIPFINRPAHIFKHILALAQDDNYLYPIKYQNELDFYDITYDVGKLYDPVGLGFNNTQTHIDKNICQLSKDMDNKINKLYDVISGFQNFEHKEIDSCNRENCDAKKDTENNTRGYCYEHWQSCSFYYSGMRRYCNKLTENKLHNGHYMCEDHIL